MKKERKPPYKEKNEKYPKKTMPKVFFYTPTPAPAQVTRRAAYSGYSVNLCYACGGRDHDIQTCPRLFTTHFAPTHITVNASLYSYNVFIPTTLELDPAYPTTLGWRAWFWDEITEQLLSPLMGTCWESPELRAPEFDSAEQIRTQSGIHAYRVPLNWRKEKADIIREQYLFNSDLNLITYTNGIKRIAGPAIGITREERKLKVIPVHGIVERFGEYRLGEVGWRSEWAVIRELQAPTEEIGLKIERMFPDVKVHFSLPEENLRSFPEESLW